MQVSTHMFSMNSSTNYHIFTTSHQQLHSIPYLLLTGGLKPMDKGSGNEITGAYSQISMQKGEVVTAPQTYTHLPTANGTELSEE